MLLGGNCRDRVEVYTGIFENGRYGTPPPGQFAQMAGALAEEWGFSTFKVKPYLMDIHRHRWGEVCDGAAAYFAAASRSLPRILAHRLRGPRHDRRTGAGGSPGQGARTV